MRYFIIFALYLSDDDDFPMADNIVISDTEFPSLLELNDIMKMPNYTLIGITGITEITEEEYNRFR